VYQNKDHTNQRHIVIKSNNIDISNLRSLLEIAKKVSKLINIGDNIFLYGALGVGKTTFVRNLINQLQNENKINITEVLSPTFNILNEYIINNMSLNHYDLYRIKHKEELDNLRLFEEKDVINIVEWPEIIKNNKIKSINFDFSYSPNFKNRSLIISSNYSNKIIDEFRKL
tara:strand:+ start:7 stop:519 length:513 start_codon:yes stop_codon:yes gene_type:complete